MTKNEFIEKLKKELQNESYQTVCQTITYYEEMIDDLVEDGYSEKEAVSKLGHLKDIVANVHGQEFIEIKKMKKSTSITMIVLLILGFPLWGALVAAGACLLLSLLILIWCIPLATVSLAISGSIAFVVGIMGGLVLFSQSVSLGITQLGLSALFGAAATIGIYLTYITTGYFWNYTKQINTYIKQWCLNGLRKAGIVC